MSKLQIKWLGIAGLTALCLFLLYPTASWYQLDPAERSRLEESRLRPKRLLNLGLDLKGGTHLLMELDGDKLPPTTDLRDAVDRAIEVIRNRVDQLGIAEPLIAKQGDRWIVVQLPGITNSAQAKELVGKTALLEFRLVDSSTATKQAMQKIAELGSPFIGKTEGHPVVSAEAAKHLPPGTTILSGRDDSFYIVSASAALTGAELETARVEIPHRRGMGMPVVAFRFKPEGARAFAALTGANAGKNLAIVLDGVVYSAPVIKGRIVNNGVIEGNFRMEEASSLALVLRSGALPAPLRIIEERSVGATLGEDSIRLGLLGSAAGIAIIFLFFIVKYGLSGVFADLAMVLNLMILMALMAYFGATLTLPGIAGIALNVAMAVDANILVLERIREELAKGKPVPLAVDAGYNMSAGAILDSNLTLLAASALLFQFGTGPIKGFAVTLSLGNIISMFTATVVTRLMYQAWLSGSTSASPSLGLSINRMQPPALDWIGRRYLFFVLSGVLILSSLGSIALRGFNYGIDFLGGTLVQVTYTSPKSLASLREDLGTAGYPDAVPQSFPATNSFGIRLKGSERLDAQSIETFVEKLKAADPSNSLRVDRKEYVGPSVGRYLRRQATQAVLLALAAIIAYVAFRFSNPLWGTAGVIALAHDVIATAGLFSLTGKEVDLVVVAALLTIAGYSINDTIVIFDRMREKLRFKRNEPMRSVINASINETLSRTLMTNGNVIAVVLALYLFGGPVIHDFALAMLFGGVVGTYSTVAIATPLVWEWASTREERRTMQMSPKSSAA